MPETSPIPTLLAFIVCDTVILDASTKKRTLVGIFDRIAGPKLPLMLRCGLYAKLVDGSGPYKVKVRMVSLKDESLLMQIDIDLKWNAPDESMELGMNFGGVQLPEAGKYEFQLFTDDIYLGRAVIKAVQLELPPQAGPARG